MRYRYAGTDPQPDEEGGIARPGEIREFEQEPSWGPWEPVPDGEAPQAAESPAAAPADWSPAPRAPSAAPASTAPSAAPPADTGSGGKDG